MALTPGNIDTMVTIGETVEVEDRRAETGNLQDSANRALCPHHIQLELWL